VDTLGQRRAPDQMGGMLGLVRLVDLEADDLAAVEVKSPFAKSWGGQSPAIGTDEAVEHQADHGQGDHRLGDLG
jgi:hypothetical protein